MALALATAILHDNPSEAATLAEEVTNVLPVRQAWTCLVAARQAAGNHAGALEALRRLLGEYAIDEAITKLATIVCSTSASGHWCGIDATGRVVGEAAGDRLLLLDGRRLGATIRRLPRDWMSHRMLAAFHGKAELIGSPIRLDLIVRAHGIAKATTDGGIEGWCWQPGMPDTTPVLTLEDDRGRKRRILPTGLASSGNDVLYRHWAWSIPSDETIKYTAPIRILAQDGSHLPGSPLDPAMFQRATADLARTWSPRCRPQARRQVTAPLPLTYLSRRRTGAARRAPACVVIPVHDGGQVVIACLQRIIRHVPRSWPIILVDDESRDPAIRELLDTLATRPRVTLVRLKAQGGFPRAANTGMRAAAGHDVLLLNSDALPPPGAFAHLRKAAYSCGDIGTVSPLSNDATLLTYPDNGPTTPPDDEASLMHLAALVADANGSAVVDIPTGVGFCMYIRRDCLDDVGLFREDAFAQGYGEENDFCLRARHLGWRHVAAVGAYVAHAGSASFAATKNALIERNLGVLEWLHPGWRDLIEDYGKRDPLFDARRRIDARRWRRTADARRPSVIFVTHADGGGVERILRERVAAAKADGRRAIILRPGSDEEVRICDSPQNNFPDLSYRLPDEASSLHAFLRSCRPERIEYHHMLGHHPSLLGLGDALGIPFQVYVHDYALLCPRVTLIGRDGRYCGEPDASTCDHCVADAGRMIEETIDTADLRLRSAAFLARAAAIVAPSDDAAARLQRHFTGLKADVRPHEQDTVRPLSVGRGLDRLVVAVVGALGIDKGYQVLLDCARDAADRRLPLTFVLVGHSIDDARLLQTGRCFVTGPYREGEAADLIRQERAAFGFIPSIWPETWCFALSEIWRADLPAIAFDIGAPADRIRATRGGLLLPLGLAPGAVNAALLAAPRQFGHV
ncbi:glycosyltransferase [Acidisphaera rubrifaciens]|uniref:Glycosyl transferase n=1 Tax=Acidisphaera rubrifaciens HS-AP3 TaxID=1231350 RepID=A0A0D6P5T1_9PROT|nr:glycosyltransferase [Acidisphaera rubrifaciens]GAN76686.1 glycosyl transferase [Acidisphaera rubrifaciens HS-AP3]